MDTTNELVQINTGIIRFIFSIESIILEMQTMKTWKYVGISILLWQLTQVYLNSRDAVPIAFGEGWMLFCILVIDYIENKREDTKK